MTTTDTITIPDEDTLGRDGADICLADDVRGAIVHNIGPDCARLHGLRITERRCSVCDQEWGESAYSRHEGCADLYPDGSRRTADCVAYLSDGRAAQIAEA